ncbi:Pisatin demethylase [Cladobotryum mycophilum]|uniref:Pisatin demethylase n=1 Tax=Cladobotryum mycophilum TaxID=491253 RepID=A0ABR0SHP3_9HYPO
MISKLVLLLGLVIAFRGVYLIIINITSSTRSIPGPLLARFTRFWYFKRVYHGRFEYDNLALHQKYGPVVRVAPNMYSIDLPDAMNQVYGVGSKLPKSDWYEAWKHPSPDRWTLFPDRDIKRHAQTRRVFQGLYSMSSLVSYETYVDECADLLETQFFEITKRGGAIDMFHWFQCYAFDVIGNITYSERFGFLDRGEDVSGLMNALHGVSVYSTMAGIFSSWHPYLFAVMNWMGTSGAAGRSYLMQYVEERVRLRRLQKASDPDKFVVGDENSPQDFLEKLMLKNKEAPSKVSDYHMFMMGISNIVAGSDTTAISLSAILYYLIRNPIIMAKLREEVDDCVADGRFAGDHLSFKDSLDLPYLQAAIKEALRLHPATGLPLWRDIPEGGMELNGQFFPAGSTVGLNTWCAHYNEDVFGRDAKEFRPERWIEAEKEGGQRLARMNAYYLPFGQGSRTCVGRHISYLEMAKLVPLLVKKFDFELEKPGLDWETLNYWFVKPVNFWVRVRARC